MATAASLGQVRCDHKPTPYQNTISVCTAQPTTPVLPSTVYVSMIVGALLLICSTYKPTSILYKHMTQESVTFLKNFLVELRRKLMILLLGISPHIAQGWVLPGFHSDFCR